MYAQRMAWIDTIDATRATGELARVYDRMRERPMPLVYRPPHGGAPGIILAHSLDPALIALTFGVARDGRYARVGATRGREHGDVARQSMLLLNVRSRRVSACRGFG
jgi:hypothetical protein